MAIVGSITALYLYDVGNAIDLTRVGDLVGTIEPARLRPKAVTPTYIQYQQPPVRIDGQAIAAPAVDGFRVGFKAFDYGVVSVVLTRPFEGTWDDLLRDGLHVQDNPQLSAAAEGLCRQLLQRLGPAVSGARREFLTEDYVVFAITSPTPEVAAASVLVERGAQVAQLLRGERSPLSTEERDEVLKHRISYFANDLLVPTWNGAFVYDSEAGIQGAVDLFEFANSQLLQFRYYDQLLDAELADIYAQLQAARWGRTWLGRRYTRAAHQVHSLFIDVTELTDKAENALKMAGDVYTARVFTLTAARLGLDQWKTSVREKLKTLDAIYRFAVEQTAMARGELLEAAIVAILVLELVLFFAGVMT